MSKDLAIGQEVVFDNQEYVVVAKKLWPLTKYLLKSIDHDKRLAKNRIVPVPHYKVANRRKLWIQANPKDSL